MAPRRRMAKKRPARRPRRAGGVRARRVPRAFNPMAQSTTVVETIDFTNLDINISKQLTLNTFSLRQFPRANAIAPFFKQYKAVECIWGYEAFNNTYQQDNDGTPDVTMPYYSWIMNRNNDTQPLNAVRLGADPSAVVRVMGAQPKAFNKKVVIRYKPNWNLCGQTIAVARDASGAITSIGNQELTPTFKYLSCPNLGVSGTGTESVLPAVNPGPQVSGIQVPSATGVAGDFAIYGGHLFYLDQATRSATEPLYKLVLTVKWHFKQPNYIPPGSRVEVPSQYV